MRIRKSILPRRLSEVLCFLLIAVFLPIVYIFEMSVVVPAFHDFGGFFFVYTFLLGVFLIFNIKGNMMACMLVDTSVNVQNITAPENARDLGWTFCDNCEMLIPPRAWHCKVCRVCILKRDHHCLFTGYCVGHKNHRYFIMFVIYLFIGALYTFVYNSVYIWVLNSSKYCNMLTALKILCPAFIFLSGDFRDLELIYYGLNIFALVFTFVMLVYHLKLILRGNVCYDDNKGYSYDAGWKENLRIVLGERAHLAWLSPLIVSNLICDGTHWDKKRRIVKGKSEKVE